MPRNSTKNYKKTKKKTQTLDKSNLMSLGFVVVGICLIAFVAVYRFYDSRRLSFNSFESAQVQEETSPPINIKIPKFKLNVDISPTTIKDGVWQINEDQANFLVDSASPGQNGNIVIYGHNSNETFGPLRWMSGGEIIEITSEDGAVTTYQVDNIFETNPEDIQWVLPKDTETLTLYTCSGFLNSKRHIVIAKPIVEEILEELPTL